MKRSRGLLDKLEEQIFMTASAVTTWLEEATIGFLKIRLPGDWKGQIELEKKAQKFYIECI